MHSLATTFVLGYQGCDEAVAESLLQNEPFRPSENPYDWLGHGIYFWGGNPRRALEFARELKRRNAGKPNVIEKPAVVGAVIDLGFYLDLISSSGIAAVKVAYENYMDLNAKGGVDPPVNRLGNDLLLRELDCEVINHLHAIRAAGRFQPYDTVRGVFIEGSRIYKNAGFFEKTHIQICVRDAARINGVFRVRREDLDPA